MVGWVSSIPADKSQTQASPPSWLATTLSRRNRTGSDSAFSCGRQLDGRFSREWLTHKRDEGTPWLRGQRQLRLRHTSILTDIESVIKRTVHEHAKRGIGGRDDTGPARPAVVAVSSKTAAASS